MKQIIFSIIIIAMFTLSTNQLSAQTFSKANAKSLENHVNLEHYMTGFVLQAQRITGNRGLVCPTVTRDKANKKITINFNNSCTTPDGKSITGTLMITYVGKGQVNDVRQITATDLVIDNNAKLNGNWTISKGELNDDDKFYCTANFDGTVYYLVTGETFYLDYQHVFTWIDGTAIGKDAKVAVTGTGFAKLDGDVRYESEIKSNDPLVYDLSCVQNVVYTAVSGTVVATLGIEFTLDYGDGTCDNIAYVDYEYINKRGQRVEVKDYEVDMIELRRIFQ